MKKVIDSNGDTVGTFDGNSIKSDNGDVLFRIIDGEVFQPYEYSEKELQHMNKGQLICIGALSDNEAVTSDGDLLFKLI